MKERIYLSPPHLGSLELDLVREAFDTNWISSVGPHIPKFEKALAENAGVKAAVALASGTAALHLALKLAGVTQGDYVLCSSFTFAASAWPIVYEKATPIFLDSEPGSWNLSPDALRAALADCDQRGIRPKALIAVSLYGLSADLDLINELCASRDIVVIEDAAEALGATYKGRPAGGLAKFGVFSFNGNKIITTSGGGVLLSNDEKAMDKARFWSTQARDPAPHYQHSEVGYNYRMSNVLAGIGIGQLSMLEDRVNARRNIFERYRQALGDLPGVVFMPETEDCKSTRWMTVATIDPTKSKSNRNKILAALEENNIEARPAWKPMHLQPVFAGAKYFSHSDHQDVCAQIFEAGVCLPSGSNLTEAQQSRVIEIVKGTFQ